MKPLRVAALCVIIVSFFVWLFVPFLTFETWGADESQTAFDLLSDNESDIWMHFGVALVSLLALIFCLIDIITPNPGRGLISSAGMGIGVLVLGLMRAFAVDYLMQSVLGGLSSLAGDEYFNIGFYVLLIAFIVLYCLGRAIKKEAEAETALPPTTYTYLSKNAKQTVNKDATNTPNAQTVDENDVQWLTCCQCGKTAKRTEFYEININGNANLGTCHQCYCKFY